MIFDWYTEDRKPTSWIAKQLSLMGVPTSKGNKDWARTTIKEILFNEHYIGKIVWGKLQTVKVKDPKTGRLVKKRKRNDSPSIYEGKHEGIISEEQFWKDREIYGSQAPVKTDNTLSNPLAGLLVCHQCGRVMCHQPYPDNRKRRYFHPRGVYTCKMKSIKAGDVIDAIASSLKEYIEDFRIKIANGDTNSEAERQLQAIAEMEKELSKQERMKRRLFDSWEADDGTYTREEFLERKGIYTRTIEYLNAEITKMQNETPAVIDYEEQISTFHTAIEYLKDQDAEAKEKNDFFKTFIEKIELDTIDLGTGKGSTPVLEIHFK